MRSILEIGGGATPYFIRYDIPWNTEDTYICLDIDEARLEKSREKIQELETHNLSAPTNREFYLADAIDMHFPSESIDEVVLSNVLSAPIHLEWNEDANTLNIKNKSGHITRSIKGTDGDEDVFFAERMAMIKETLRVLRPGGTLTIYTDLLIYGVHSYERILHILANHPEYRFRIDESEQARVDEINIQKIASKKHCHCFTAEVLPRSTVVKIRKR